MFQKVKVLLYKDLEYRIKITTFVTYSILIVLAFFANISSTGFFSCCHDLDRINERGFRSSNQFPESIHKCASTPFDNADSKTLAYEPSSPYLRKLMEDVACLVGFNRTSVVEGFDKKFDFGVKFNGIKEGQIDPPESLDYVLYPTNDYNFETSSKALKFKSPDNFKFSPVQKMKLAIDRAFLREKENSEYPSEKPKPQAESWDCYDGHDIYHPPDSGPDLLSGNHCLDGSYTIFYKVILPFLIFFLESDRFLTCIIKEKNSGIREFLKLMGVKIWLIRFSAFLMTIITNLITIFIILFFMYVPITRFSFVYFTVDAGTMFFYFFICALYIPAFLYMESFCFQNVHIASLINTILWITAMFLFGLIEHGSPASNNLLRVISFLPQYWCLEGFILLAKFERLGKKVGFYEKVSPKPNYLFALDFFLIGIFGTILYVLIGAYLENVLPGKYGRSLPLYYIFTKSFWTNEEVKQDIEVREAVRQNREMFEEKPRNLTIGISVQNLTKSYSFWKNKKSTKALDNVTFDVYEGEILGLLGHNGAGKTTLISILCGMIPATSGKVTVNGKDIQYRDKGSAAIGYCAQYDILLCGLTVYTNLKFFGMLRGLSRSEAALEARTLIEKIGLQKSKRSRASSLSGGQKRALSLAIALIGDSPVLMLDEPTSGIDVSTRREIWELLLKVRGKKTIILSTHSMEEADVLSDRIVVLAEGQIKSSGTPMFLKSKLGSGYTLSVVVSNKGKSAGVTDLILKKIKGSALKRQNLLTLSYKLPEKEFSAFPGLFESLEGKKRNGDVVSYGATVSTMEDVFLNLDEVLRKGEASKKGIVEQDPVVEEYRKKPNLTGCSLYCNQLLALLGITLALDAIFDYVVKKASYRYSDESGGNCFRRPSRMSYQAAANTLEKFSRLEKVIIRTQGVERRIWNLFLESFLKDYSLNASVDYKYLKNSKPYSSDNPNDIYRIPRKFDPDFFPETDDTSFVTFFSALRFHNLFLLFFLFGIVQEYELQFKTYQMMLVSPIIYRLPHILFDFPLLVIHSVFSHIIQASSDSSIEKIMKTYYEVFVVGQLFHIYCILLITYILAKACSRFVVACVYLVLCILLGAIFGFHVMVFILFFIGMHWIKYFFPTSRMMDYYRSKFEGCEPELYEFWEHFESREDPYCGYSVILLTLLLINLDNGIIPYIFHKWMTCCCCVEFEQIRSEDATIRNEEEKVRDWRGSRLVSRYAIVIDRVKRWYWSCRCCEKCAKVGVNGVSFTVGEGECFGLLGVNGAGKTTIFKILTGMIQPTQGGAYVSYPTVLNFCSRSSIFSKMGYCSQAGNYLPNFNGREMIELLGRLRGMSGSRLKKEIDRLVKIAQLQEYGRKKCSSYSGGTLRKAAVLMAVIGDPLILILDEPTTVIDPAARRSIWDLITKFREEGRSVLFSSHSMEECEALSSRVGIMIKGRMRCIGEPTTLKNLFGQTYSISFKLSIKAKEKDRSKLKKAMTDTFGTECRLLDENLGIMQYLIPMKSTNWEKLFSSSNSLKSKNSFIEDFSVSSAGLEQVFLHFAEQEKPRESDVP